MSRFPDLPGISSDALRTVFLISKREYITRVRSRFFLIGTAVFMVLLAGYVVFQATVLNRTTTTVKVGFTGASTVLAQPLKATGSSSLKIETRDVTDVQRGRQQVESGSLDVLVSGDPASPDVAVKDDLNPTIAATLVGVVKQIALSQALSSAGVDAATVEGKVVAAHFNLQTLDPNAAVRSQRAVVGVFVAILLYVSLLIYGQLVAAGVVEEKANRIVEILLATVRPRQLLLGKVIGIGLVGLTQMVALGVVALIAVSSTQVISVPDVGFTAVAGGLLWFILGFLLYALVFAAGGSMVSRQEDLGSVTAPLSMLMIGAYLAFFWVEANPDNPLGI
ncbi:MAG TPA: ABC transporter permease, partial [Candidatus Sulfotelmatobacter sp.]|nr:ABC transporter permease [Candidatus Sulfotelmatobacter sp.]